MGILERYLGYHFLRGYLLVLLVLLALFGFLDFVDELSEVGEGDYRIGDALLYVLSTYPSKVLDFSAICSLMGGSLALAGLVRSSEIVAMRAAGMSLSGLALALAKVMLLMVLLLLVVAEYFGPMTRQWGFLYRHEALEGKDALRTEHGFWSRDRTRFLNVRAIIHGRVPQDVDIYHFDTAGKLLQFLHARRAEVREAGEWMLEEVTIKSWNEGLLLTRHRPTMSWRSFLTPQQLKTLELPPETLSITDLWYYVRYLKTTNQESNQYELMFWQRILLPISMAVMLLFLLPMAATSPRSGGFGWQVAVAIIVGVFYFLATQVVANLGLLWDFPPLLTALTPTAVVLLLALLMLRWCRY